MRNIDQNQYSSFQTKRYAPEDQAENSIFRHVPRTGVIYVMTEAHARGYFPGNPEWSNFGQGAPETGDIPNCAQRIESFSVSQKCFEYGHVIGIPTLRAAVAELYNKRYRQGMASQYTMENVAISPGGRPGLARIAATLGHVNLGHMIPDYTAYEELLDLFRNIVAIPILLRAEDGYRPHYERLRDEVMGRGLGAVLMSNPSNPTGQLIWGTELDKWLDVLRELRSAIIMDEFYSHYHYHPGIQSRAISAAAHVEDVNKDQIIIVDGLSKNWRYPGLRISWTIAPKHIISSIASAGSFLDGGANHPVQSEVIPLLEHSVADQEALSIQTHFKQKRDMVLERFKRMGFELNNDPQGGFYAFFSLDKMPEGLRDGRAFFEKALEYKVICVPGVYFDVDPGKRRSHLPSRLSNYIRISYGPSIEELNRGMDNIERMIEDTRYKT